MKCSIKKTRMIRCVLIISCLLLLYMCYVSNVSRYEMMKPYGIHITLHPHVNDIVSLTQLVRKRNMYIGVPDHKPKFGYFVQVFLNGQQINSPIGFPGEESLTWVFKHNVDHLYTFVEHDYTSLDSKTKMHIPIRLSKTDNIQIKAYAYTSNHMYQIMSFEPTVISNTNEHARKDDNHTSSHTMPKSIQAPNPPFIEFSE